MDDTLKQAMVAALRAMTVHHLKVAPSDATLEQYVDKHWGMLTQTSMKTFLKQAQKDLVGPTNPVLFLPDGVKEPPSASQYTRIRLPGSDGEWLTRLSPIGTVNFLLEQGWTRTAMALTAYYAKHHPHG